MQRISTYTGALKAIWHRSGYDRGFISNPFAGDDAARLGLRRTQALLHSTGHTELPYKIAHVAGSKGKGSTSTMIDAILRAAGLRTGRYLSPHLHSFRERFVVDDAMIPEDDFVALARELISASDEVEKTSPEIGAVTAFEISTAMALAWFAKAAVDIAVIEVGMGGELDSTNIVTPDVSVITTLDFEHTAVLGSTMAEIAQNKAGIIKPGQPALTAMQPDDALAVIVDRAAELNAPLAITGQDWQVSGDDRDFTFTGMGVRIAGLQSSLVGDHQVANAGLAIAAILTLAEAEAGMKITPEAIREGLASARLPGRFEIVELPEGKTVVIDGAHTAVSAQALAKSIQDRFPGTKVTLVIGMLQDKDASVILSPLIPLAQSWIAVAPENPRALPVEALMSEIAAPGAEPTAAQSVAAGIDMARKSEADFIVVTGSLTTPARVS